MIHSNFKHVQFQEVKGLPSNMPASYHWGPPASTLAHRLAVRHPKNSGCVGLKGPMPCPAWYCRAISYRHGTLTFETTHCRHRSTSPTPGQRCADWTTRRTRAHARIPTSSPWVERDFARPHLPNSKSAQTRGKAILSENQRSSPATSTVESLPSARTHTIHSNFKHVQFQEVKGLPSNMPASYHWGPPASTLAHRLAVIHPKNSGCVGLKGPMPCPAWYCRAISYRWPLRPRIAGTAARAPHPANGVRTEQLGAHGRIPTSSPWVERDFARPHLPNSKSAQTRGMAILSENQRSRDPRKDLPCNIDRRILTQRKNSYDPFKLQTCPVSRSERPPLQHASQLPLGTPSEHFSASSRCHTSQKFRMCWPQGSNAMPCVVLPCYQLSAWYTDLWDHALQAPQHEPHTRPTVCGLNN